MTEATNNDQESLTGSGPTELDLLRDRAERLGINVPPNIKADTLRKRIEEALNIQDPALSAQKEQIANTTEDKMLKARSLVRCSIVCNDPDRKDLKGEIFTVANRFVGRISRMIPYDVRGQTSWHLEHALVRMLERKKYYRVFQQIDQHTGRPVDHSVLVPLFTVTRLPPLTEQELEALRQAQAAQKD